MPMEEGKEGYLKYNDRKFYPYTAVELLVDNPFNNVESQISTANNAANNLATRFDTSTIMVIKES